jgi:hypothetical protein
MVREVNADPWSCSELNDIGQRGRESGVAWIAVLGSTFVGRDDYYEALDVNLSRWRSF